MKYVILLLVFFMAAPAMAQDRNLMVELDLDGVTGNGPDTILVAPKDSVVVDVWVVWEGEAQHAGWDGFQIFIVDNGHLDFVDAELLMPSHWVPGTISESGDTVWISAFDFIFSGSPDPPQQVFIVLYQASLESGIASLGVDLEWSNWSATWGPLVAFTGYVGATVVIDEPTSTEQTSWGGVKRLFR